MRRCFELSFFASSNPLVSHNTSGKHAITTVSLGVNAQGDRRPQSVPRNTLRRHYPVSLSMVLAKITTTKKRPQDGSPPPTAPPTAPRAAAVEESAEAVAAAVVVVVAVTATALTPRDDRATLPRAPRHRRHDPAQQLRARGPLGPTPKAGLLSRQTLSRTSQT